MTHALEADVDAVLFDFGGTLFDYGCLRPAMHDALVQLCQEADLTPSDRHLAAAYVAALRKSFSNHLDLTFYRMRDVFRQAAIDTLDWLVALGGLSGADIDPLAGLDDTPASRRHRVAVDGCDPFLTVQAADFRLRDGVVETLRALRESGRRIGLVTNMDVDQLAHLVSVSGLGPEIDFALGSEEVRSCKPDRRIFSEAVDRAGSAAARTLFVGDSVFQDIEGAKRAGLRPVLVSRRADGQVPPGVGPVPVLRVIPDLLEIVEPTSVGGRG
jgi:HAD superfamily hydrolase (TIGR01509 family)